MKGHALFALLMLLTMPASGEAQATTRVGDRPTCASCVAELRPVVRLGSVDDPAGFAPLAQIAVNSTRQYLVSSPTFTGEVFVYGPDGRFQQAIGRRGEGPGEFARMQLLGFGPGDTLHAVEANGSRHSVFAPDFSFVRAVQLRARTLAIEIEADGTLFAVSPSAGDPANALQTFAPDGSPLNGFDPVDPNLTGQAAIGRSIALDVAGRRWSIGTARYRIKQWDRAGGLVRQFEATREWIPETLPMRLEPRQRPPSQIGGLEFDDSGMLWVFAVVPDANWSPPQPNAPPNPNQMYDTLLEVIDPATGELVARSRFEHLALPFGRGRAYSMLEEESGDLRLQVWRMELVRR